MSNKKYGLLGIGIISTVLVLILLSKNTFVVDSVLEKNKNIKDKYFSTGLALMVETKTGSGEYVKTENVTWAELDSQGYALNTEKSTCKNGSTLSWNEENKTIIFSGSFSDNCTVYFDKGLSMANYIINKVYTKDGVGGLYYHDGKGDYTNATLEAGDNSYRYAGTNPNNYLCFKEGCTDDEKYRIIGVFDGKIKVISNFYDGESSFEDPFIEENLIMYLNSEEYLTSLGNIVNLIDSTTWHIGEFTWNEAKSENAKGIYTAELSGTSTIERQVGLMYVSDYMYAAEPTYWNLTGYNDDATKDYRASKGHDWMLIQTADDVLLQSKDEWTFTPASSGDAFLINTSGCISSTDKASLINYRGSFSLSPSVKLKSGTGTSSDPYIVGL